MPLSTIASSLEMLRGRLDARAAGVWSVEPAALVLAAFAPAADLEPRIAARFTQATSRVSLESVELGIVQAALTGAPAVSETAMLRGSPGSGSWLEAFGADRSVAVPVMRAGAAGAVLVVSVAVRGPVAEVPWITESLLDFGQGWADSL
jgi:hypothetical protein